MQWKIKILKGISLISTMLFIALWSGSFNEIVLYFWGSLSDNFYYIYIYIVYLQFTYSLTLFIPSWKNYEVEFLLYRRWQDTRLSYEDQNRHKYLNGISHINDVWLPNTYIVKHGSLKDPLADVSLRIYSNGTVVHIMRYIPIDFAIWLKY